MSDYGAAVHDSSAARLKRRELRSNVHMKKGRVLFGTPIWATWRRCPVGASRRVHPVVDAALTQARNLVDV